MGKMNLHVNFVKPFFPRQTMIETGNENQMILAVIDQATEISAFFKKYEGKLSLIRENDLFYIDFSSSNPSKINCSNIKEIQVTESNKENIMIIFTYTNSHIINSFEFKKCEHILSFTKFLEELVINGIAVPSPPDALDKNEIFSMEFYHHCHNGVFPYKPTNIHLIVDRNEGSLERIWKKFHVFVQSLFSQLDISNTIPNDPSYPFLTAARASHQRVLDEIINYIKNSTQQPPLTNTEWQNFFDSDGRLTDFDHIKNRIYHSGVEASLLPDVIPFIFGLHKSDSTSSERNDINLQLDHEFDVLLRQTKSYQPQQVSNNKKMYAAFRVIHHIILRTDRQLSAFKKENGIGLKILTDLLRTYTIYNPPIGYLQGMNDLFVPILLAFIPKWDESSSPVTENGYEQYLPRIFWSFDSMLQHLHHMKMLNDIATECEKMTGVVFSILSEVSPLASIWLRKNNLQNLLWMYSDFVLLFKRSFDDVWSVWTKLSTSPDPPNWFSYFTAAILILIFNEIGTLEEITTPVIMDSFSKFMAKLNVDDIGLAAMYLYERFKVPKKKKKKTKM